MKWLWHHDNSYVSEFCLHMVYPWANLKKNRHNDGIAVGNKKFHIIWLSNCKSTTLYTQDLLYYRFYPNFHRNDATDAGNKTSISADLEIQVKVTFQKQSNLSSLFIARCLTIVWASHEYPLIVTVLCHVLKHSVVLSCPLFDVIDPSSLVVFPFALTPPPIASNNIVEMSRQLRKWQICTNSKSFLIRIVSVTVSS